MKIKDIGEIGLIKRISKKIKLDRSVVKGIGDDTAVIDWTKNKYMLFTCDILIEDVHFKTGSAKPFQIGYKALARNISDIAAMGGVPKYALLSVGMSPALTVKFADELFNGINSAAKRFGVNIVGGDTARSNKIVIDISLVGEVEKKNLVLRSGAKENDLILVTGEIGGSIKGKHLNFTPRLEEARKLVKYFKINSMIDVSDGLLLDLGRMLAASKAGARIYKNAIPLSPQAVSFGKAVTDGEDFELLFTMPIKEAKRFFASSYRKFGTRVTVIGQITDRRNGFKLVRPDGKEIKIKPEGYLHF